jgi:hypothetical protein
MAAELGDRFGLEKALKLGLLPVVLGAQNPQDVLPCLRRALSAGRRYRRRGSCGTPGTSLAFWKPSAFRTPPSSTSPMLRGIARSTGRQRKATWKFLEDLLLGFQIPVFTPPRTTGTGGASEILLSLMRVSSPCQSSDRTAGLAC